MQLWQLPQDRGAKSSSFFASSSIFILFWHNVDIQKKMSLLFRGEMNSAGSTAGLWGGRGGKGAVQ